MSRWSSWRPTRSPSKYRHSRPACCPTCNSAKATMSKSARCSAGLSRVAVRLRLLHPLLRLRLWLLRLRNLLRQLLPPLLAGHWPLPVLRRRKPPLTWASPPMPSSRPAGMAARPRPMWSPLPRHLLRLRLRLRQLKHRLLAVAGPKSGCACRAFARPSPPA